jgi:hypothetical protein
MVQQEQRRDTNPAPAKEFVALTHGQEWVSFYESFDKLVQDHLSRSSELLRKAMSLPEVADREVAQVRQELETKLQGERSSHRNVLDQLRSEIDSSHSQVTTIAAGIRGVTSDLEALKLRVGDAIGALDKTISIPFSPRTSTIPTPESASLGVHSAGPDAVSEQETVFAEAPAEPIAVEVDIQAAIIEDEGADRPEHVDLTALAEAESDATEESAAPIESEAQREEDSAAAERRRPHWLSVNRSPQQP